MVRPLRCLFVWLAATASSAAAARWLCGLWPTPDASFEDLLVGGCGAALAGCVGWSWLCVSAVALEAVRQRPTGWRPAPASLRRAVLLACGGAVLVTGPAVADGRHELPTRSLYAGLPFPDRAADVALLRPEPATPHVVVRPGDTLWSIAARHVAAGRGDLEISAACELLHHLNRAVIGTDPDLIHPGQRLRLPD